MDLEAEFGASDVQEVLDKLDRESIGLEPVKTAAALREYIRLRKAQPHFANARSIRNALDRARLRQANRLFARRGGPITREELMTITPEDIRASRVFGAQGAQA